MAAWRSIIVVLSAITKREALRSTRVPDPHLPAARSFLRSGALTLLCKGATIASKFFVLVYLGRELSLEALGSYGLLAVSVGMAVQLFGLDFYQVNAREIVGARTDLRAGLVRDQAVLHGVVYLIAVPMLMVAGAFSSSLGAIVGWLVVLSVTEHLSQEQSRLLTVLGRPVAANVVLFIRLGSWGCLLFVLWALGLRPRLEGVLLMWLAGILAAMVAASVLLARMGLLAAMSGRPNWRWIRSGLKQSRPFWVSTISLATIYFSDRWFLERYTDLSVVGVYTFYQSLAGLVSTSVVTGVVMVLGPQVVAAVLGGRVDDEERTMAVFGRAVWIGSLAMTAIVFLGAAPLAALLGRSEATMPALMFLVLLGGAVLSNLSALPYYRLYPRHRDGALMVAGFSAGLTNVVMNSVAVPRFGMAGAAWSTAAAFAVYVAMLSAGWRAGPRGRRLATPDDRGDRVEVA